MHSVGISRQPEHHHSTSTSTKPPRRPALQRNAPPTHPAIHNLANRVRAVSPRQPSHTAISSSLTQQQSFILHCNCVHTSTQPSSFLQTTTNAATKNQKTKSFQSQSAVHPDPESSTPISACLRITRAPVCLTLALVADPTVRPSNNNLHVCVNGTSIALFLFIRPSNAMVVCGF